MDQLGIFSYNPLLEVLQLRSDGLPFVHFIKPNVLKLSLSVYRSLTKETRFPTHAREEKINHYIGELFCIKIFSPRV